MFIFLDNLVLGCSLNGVLISTSKYAYYWFFVLVLKTVLHRIFGSTVHF